MISRQGSNGHFSLAMLDDAVTEYAIVDEDFVIGKNEGKNKGTQ